MKISTQQVAARLDAYEKLIRLNRPIGILLLLWPTLWGLWLARNAMPHPIVLWLFVLGTILMRSAGCALNDFAHRHFHSPVGRPPERPPAAATIRPRAAL